MAWQTGCRAAGCQRTFSRFRALAPSFFGFFRGSCCAWRLHRPGGGAAMAVGDWVRGQGDRGGLSCWPTQAQGGRAAVLSSMLGCSAKRDAGRAHSPKVHIHDEKQQHHATHHSNDDCAGTRHSFRVGRGHAEARAGPGRGLCRAGSCVPAAERRRRDLPGTGLGRSSAAVAWRVSWPDIAPSRACGGGGVDKEVGLPARPCGQHIAGHATTAFWATRRERSGCVIPDPALADRVGAVHSDLCPPRGAGLHEASSLLCALAVLAALATGGLCGYYCFQ